MGKKWIPWKVVTGKPSWFETVQKNSKTLAAFLSAPAVFILNRVYSDLIGGIIDMFLPILGAVQTLFIGSQLGYSKSHAAIGLADLPMVLAVLIYDVLTWGVTSYIDGLTALNRAIVPNGMVGALDGLILTAMLVIELVVTARVVAPLLKRALMSIINAIPVISGVDELVLG